MSEQKTNAAEIDVASIETLESLAAEGKFISSTHGVPHDWLAADWKFYLNGVECSDKGIIEVYAPGNDYGWAVTYVPAPDGKHTGQTQLIRGNWVIERVGHDRVHWAKDKPATDGSDLSEAPIG